MFRKFLQSYFSFSKKELNGIVVLLLLIFIFILLPILYLPAPISKPINIADFKKEVTALEQSVTNERAYSYRDVKTRENEKPGKPIYFPFNPNGLSETNWKKLGLSEKQIQVIKNYEAKGGRFYRKEDVQKMYVITPNLYQKLEPYIQIPASTNLTTTSKNGLSSALPIIDINQADSVELQNIKGIGPAFASRIIRYRDRLGGFYAKEQLKEVYGLDSAKWIQISPQIKITTSLIKKININTALFEELKNHPYLKYKQINALIQYRKQHGNYHNLQDLKNVVLLNEEILRKLEPYLIF